MEVNYDDFIYNVYKHVRCIFSDIDKDNWIWVDLFKYETIGFKYFKSNIEGDEDYDCISEILKEINNLEDLNDYAIEIAEDISSKLMKNNFFYECCMSLYYGR
jgi:hypothetical protein